MKTIGKPLDEQPSGTPDPDAVLGSLSDAAERQTETPPPPAARTSRRKARYGDRAAADQPQAASEAPLTLPKGALVVMRKSGGLHFISRQVVVRTDGRIVRTHDAATPTHKEAKRSNRLSRDELARLRLMLAKSNLAQVAGRVGKATQNPDAYAYEIVARVGRKVQAAEVFDGSIPPELEPLIRRLNSYL